MQTKQKKQPGLFDEELRLQKLSSKGDPLEMLNQKIKWEALHYKLLHHTQEYSPY